MILKFKLSKCALKFETLPTKDLIKFKLLTYSLKSYNASVPLDSFLSFNIVILCFFFCVFERERHKSEAKLHI